MEKHLPVLTSESSKKLSADSSHTKAPLNHEQIREFLESGAVLVPGLISQEITARADQAVWRCNGISPDAPQRWQDAIPKATFFDDPDLMACYTDGLLRAVAQLSDNPTRFSHGREPATLLSSKLSRRPMKPGNTAVCISMAPKKNRNFSLRRRSGICSP